MGQNEYAGLREGMEMLFAGLGQVVMGVLLVRKGIEDLRGVGSVRKLSEVVRPLPKEEAERV